MMLGAGSRGNTTDTVPISAELPRCSRRSPSSCRSLADSIRATASERSYVTGKLPTCVNYFLLRPCHPSWRMYVPSPRGQE